AVAALVGPGLHRHHIRAGARFRHRERTDVLAGNQLRQVFALLGVIAVAPDLVDAQVGVRAIGQANRRGTARDLLHRDAMLEITEARAAILLFNRDAVQSERTEPGPEITREKIGLVE